jgi:hypothetical protein
MVGALAGILASLVASYAGSKIANRVNRSTQSSPSIAQRMQNMNNNTSNSAVSGIKGNTGPEGGPLQFPLYSPEQMARQEQTGKMGQEGLQKDPFNFAPIKAATMEDYYQNLMPQLMERLAGLGGNQNDSGILNTLGQSGISLERQLAGDEQKYNQMSGDRYLQMFDQGNKPQYENMMLSPQPSSIRNVMNKAFQYGVPAAATLGGAYMNYQGNQSLAQSLNANRPAAPAPLNTNYNFLKGR